MSEKKTYVLIVSKSFFGSHPRKGESTRFKEQILEGKKKHTIRNNYIYWKKIVDRVNSGNAVLSLRQWSGKAYRSKQEEICVFEKLGIQKIFIGNHPHDGHYALVDSGISPEISELAKNDGLHVHNFIHWFSQNFEGAIIHFTDFRY